MAISCFAFSAFELVDRILMLVVCVGMGLLRNESPLERWHVRRACVGVVISCSRSLEHAFPCALVIVGSPIRRPTAESN